MKQLLLTCVAVFMTGCVANNIEITTTKTKDRAVFEKAKILVADSMKDPETTRFKPEYATYKTNYGDDIVCGTVNAKNAMGGYVGYRIFYVRIRGGSVVSLWVSPDDGSTYSMARDACAEAATGKMTVSS